MIGFSGDDPNFLQWIGWLRDNLGHENSPKMYLIGLLSLSHSQKMLLERRNIIPVDMSQCLGVNGNHYQALEQFLEHLRLRRTDDNRLDWPSTSDDETTPNDVDDPAALVATWKSQRCRYPRMGDSSRRPPSHAVAGNQTLDRQGARQGCASRCSGHRVRLRDGVAHGEMPVSDLRQTSRLSRGDVESVLAGHEFSNTARITACQRRGPNSTGSDIRRGQAHVPLPHPDNDAPLPRRGLRGKVDRDVSTDSGGGDDPVPRSTQHDCITNGRCSHCSP